MKNQRFQSSTIWLDRAFPIDSAELLLTGAGSGVKRDWDWDWDWDWDCDGGCCCCSTTTPYCGQEVGLGLGKTARVRLKEGCVKKEGCWIVVVGCDANAPDVEGPICGSIIVAAILSCITWYSSSGAVRRTSDT